MKKTLCLWLLSATVWAQPSPTLSQTKEFEVSLCPAGSRILPGADGDSAKAVALSAELYRRAGPRLGCRFVESCYLLVLGDLRPYGGWNGFIPGYTPEDEEVFDRLNRYLVPRGLSIHPERAGLREAGQVGAWSMYSLGGLERRSRECHLEWLPKFQRSHGWAGYYTWQRQFQDALKEHVAASRGHFSEGFMLGYPDSAIDAVDELFRMPLFARIDACISDADYYECGLPVYAVRAKEYNQPDVQQNEQEWGRFLSAAYHLPEHDRLAADGDFLAARQALNPQPDFRYQESRRLEKDPPPLRPIRPILNNSVVFLKVLGRVTCTVQGGPTTNSTKP